MAAKAAKQRVVIVGAAGQARELAHYVEDVNRERETFELLGFVVTDPSRLGPRDSRERVLGGLDWLEEHQGEIDGALLGVGYPAVRAKLAGELSLRFPRLDWPSVVHPSALRDASSCTLGRGCLVAAGVTMTVNVALGDFAMLNFGCTVGHETVLGRAAVVHPGANLSGGVTLGRGVLVGAGAVVLQYLAVGDEAVVAAGAVVTRDVPPGVTVVGIPARPQGSAPTKA